MISSPDAYRALQRFKESLRVGATFSATLSNADGLYFVFALFIANFARLYSGANIVQQSERDLRSFLKSRFSFESPLQIYTASSPVSKVFSSYFRFKNPRITQLTAV